MKAVALHGFTGRPGCWSAVAAGAIEPPLAGHAPERQVPRDWQFADEVDRIADEIDRLGEPVHLLGYSMGGRLALAVAARVPVARLTLVGASPGLEEEPARAARRARDEVWCALLEERGIEAFARAWEDQPMWRSQMSLPAAARERQRADRMAHDPHQLAAALRALGLGAMPSLWPALAQIRAPVVDVVAGALDTTYAELARQMAAHMPQARFIAVAGAGHNPILEQADALRRALFGQE